MQDNAPSHASRNTADFLAQEGLPARQLMTWQPSSLDLNSVENLWALVKKELYKGVEQYKSISELWDAIQTTVTTVTPEIINALISSIDERLMKIIEKKGGHINM